MTPEGLATVERFLDAQATREAVAVNSLSRSVHQCALGLAAEVRRLQEPRRRPWWRFGW